MHIHWIAFIKTLKYIEIKQKQFFSGNLWLTPSVSLFIKLASANPYFIQKEKRLYQFYHYYKPLSLSAKRKPLLESCIHTRRSSVEILTQVWLMKSTTKLKPHAVFRNIAIFRRFSWIPVVHVKGVLTGSAKGLGLRIFRNADRCNNLAHSLAIRNSIMFYQR